MLSKVSRFLHVQPWHWSERIPRALRAKTLGKSPMKKWRPPRKCAWMLFAKPKALSVRKWSHTAMFGFCSAAHCDRSLGESEYALSMMGPLWLSGKIAQIKASACMPQPHSLLNSFSIWFFFLDVDRIHSSEKEKQQNPKSWVQFCWCPFSCG